MDNVVRKRQGPMYNEYTYVRTEEGIREAVVTGDMDNAVLTIANGETYTGSLVLIPTADAGGIPTRTILFKRDGQELDLDNPIIVSLESLKGPRGKER